MLCTNNIEMTRAPISLFDSEKLPIINSGKINCPKYHPFPSISISPWNKYNLALTPNFKKCGNCCSTKKIKLKNHKYNKSVCLMFYLSNIKNHNHKFSATNILIKNNKFTSAMIAPSTPTLCIVLTALKIQNTEDTGLK